MTLPLSGPISLKDVYEEMYGTYSSGALNTRSLSADAGFSIPDLMSDFYGLTSISTSPNSLDFHGSGNPKLTSEIQVSIVPITETWTSSDDRTWITTSDNQTTEVCDVSITKNTGAARSGTVTITHDDLSTTANVSINQDAGDSITTDVSTLTMAWQWKSTDVAEINVTPDTMDVTVSITTESPTGFFTISTDGTNYGSGDQYLTGDGSVWVKATGDNDAVQNNGSLTISDDSGEASDVVLTVVQQIQPD